MREMKSSTYLLLDGAGGSVCAAEVGSRGRVVAGHLLAVLSPLVAVFDGERGVGGVDPGADPGDLDPPARALVAEGALDGGMVAGLRLGVGVAVAGIRRRLQAVPAPLPAGGVGGAGALPRDLAGVQVGDHLGEPAVLLADLGELGLQGLGLSQSVSHTTDRVRDDRPDDAELAKEEGSHPAVQPVTCSSDRDDATLQPAAGRSSLSSVSAVVSGPLLPGDDGERPTLRSKQTGDGEQPARRAESMSSIDDRGVCVCLSAAVEAEGVRRMDSGDSDRHEYRSAWKGVGGL